MSLPLRAIDSSDDDKSPSGPPRSILLALGTWAALAAGIVIALGGFDNPQPWHNGWVRLMTILATLAALMWAARTIYPQRARRLKLAVTVSLIVHTLLAAILYREQLVCHLEPLMTDDFVRPQESPAGRLATEHMLNFQDASGNQHGLELPVATGRLAPPVNAFPRPTDLSPAPHFGQQLASELQETPSSGPRQLMVRGPQGAARTSQVRWQRGLEWDAALVSAPSLDVGTIESPAAEPQPNEHLPLDAESPLRVPMPAASSIARTTTPLIRSRKSAPHPGGGPQTPIRAATQQTSSGQLPDGALDIERMPSRRHVDAAPVLAMPAESERLAMRLSLAPVRTADERRTSMAFARRFERHRRPDSAEFPETGDDRLATDAEATIERGLEFLARVQLDDGRWQFEYLGPTTGFGTNPEQVSVQADAAATGLALLAMLGAGYDHFEGRYRYCVQHGLDYLRQVQSSSGELFPESGQAVGQVARFYGHGIATLALCEAYGMTGDAELRRPAQAAIDFLVNTQHPALGGWRYIAGTNADLSVTGWQLLALRSGESAGLILPPQTYQQVRECLEQCREEGGDRALYRYNPWASPTDPRTRHGRQPSTVMTSVGLLMELHFDGDRNSSRVRMAADHLLANLPEYGESGEVAATGTLGNPGRDTYYWYYATQAMFYLRGESWQAWSGRLFPLLVKTQTTTGPLAGSWDPRLPVPDKWNSYAGRLYVTAMNLLSLEVSHRCLPLRAATGKERIARE